MEGSSGAMEELTIDPKGGMKLESWLTHFERKCFECNLGNGNSKIFLNF